MTCTPMVSSELEDLILRVKIRDEGVTVMLGVKSIHGVPDIGDGVRQGPAVKVAQVGGNTVRQPVHGVFTGDTEAGFGILRHDVCLLMPCNVRVRAEGNSQRPRKVRGKVERSEPSPGGAKEDEPLAAEGCNHLGNNVLQDRLQPLLRIARVPTKVHVRVQDKAGIGDEDAVDRDIAGNSEACNNRQALVCANGSVQEDNRGFVTTVLHQQIDGQVSMLDHMETWADLGLRQKPP